jgi:hypothetical protein
VHSFDGSSFKSHEDLTSSYDTLGYSNMSDEELERRVKLIPIEGSKGMEFVNQDATLESILSRFFPGYSLKKARKLLLDFVLEGEEAQEEQLPDGWEEADVDDVERTIPEQAGQDKPVEFVPTHQTRRGTVFGKKTAVVHESKLHISLIR